MATSGLPSLLDVIHLGFVGAFIEELLESDVISGDIEGGLKFLPGRAQFGRAMCIVESRGIKDLAMHTSQHVPERNVRRRPGQQITALLTPNAFHDVSRLQFDEDLHQVIRGRAALGGEFLDLEGCAGRVMFREPDDGSRCVVTFDGELHVGNLCHPAQKAQQAIAQWLVSDGNSGCGMPNPKEAWIPGAIGGRSYPQMRRDWL